MSSVDHYRRRVIAAMDSKLDQAVIGVISDILNLEPKALTCDTKRKDVEGWDSMQNLNIILSLEQEFGIEMPAEAVAEIDSIETLVAWVSRLKTG